MVNPVWPPIGAMIPIPTNSNRYPELEMMADSILRSICIGEECYITLKIPIVAVIVAAVMGLALLVCLGYAPSVISKDSSPTNFTEAFVFHDDIFNLLKEHGVDMDAPSLKRSTGQTNLPFSSRLDSAVALACLTEVRDAKQQLKEVETRKEEELATLRAAISTALENLESEYSHVLEVERTSNSLLQAEVATLKAKCSESEPKSQQMVKLQTKLESKKKLADDLKRKVFAYEKQLLNMTRFETLETGLSEHVEECRNLTHSSVDLSETNRELTLRVEQIIAKLDNEAGRIHGVSMNPQGQIHGKLVKTDNSAISLVTTLSSASSAITTSPTHQKKRSDGATLAAVAPKRFFRRRLSTDSNKTKKSAISSYSKKKTNECR